MQVGTRNYPGTRDYPGIAPVPVEYDTDFYVGPLGGLYQLPSTASSVDAALSTVGGTHTSLTGAFTRDVFGYQRSWTWTYATATDRQALYLEALGRGLVPGPLYLLDPRRPNRLPEQIASGGSLLRTTTGFIASNTVTTTWRPLAQVPATSSTLPMAPILRGALQMQLLNVGGGSLDLAGAAPDGRHNVPVVPGEVLRVSLWAAGNPAASLGGSVTVYDAAGTALNTSTIPAVSLSLTAWQETSTVLVCSERAAYLRMQVATGVDAPVGSVYVTGLQVAPYNPTYIPGMQQLCPEPDFGGWWIGGGAPQVVPSLDAGSSGSSNSRSYLTPGLQAAAVTLLERSFGGTTAAQLPTLAGNTAPGSGGTGVLEPAFATRWTGGVFDGTTGATDSWQSGTPTVENNVSAFASKTALHIVEAADGSSTPGGTASAPSGAYQRIEQYVDLTGVSGIDANDEFTAGFSGYFGLSVLLDTDFPVNPRETGGGGAWQLISQWKNDGDGSPPCELNIQNGRLSLGGNSGGWSIDICAVFPGTRYDIILGLTFDTTASGSKASVWVNGSQMVSQASPTGAGFLYAGENSYWKAGVYRESGIASQARASIWYGALCFDPVQSTVAAYLTAT